MAFDLNLNLNRLIQARILNDYGDRTVNILTRSNDNVAILVNLSRDLLLVLILRSNRGVIGRVVDLNTSILLLISRLHRLLTGIINRNLVRSIRFLDSHLGFNSLTGTIRVSYHDWDGVVAGLGISRRLNLDRTVRLNSHPLRLVDLVALRISHLTARLESGSLRNLLAILVLRSIHGGLLTSRSSSVLVLRLKFTVLANLVQREEGVLTNDNIVSIHQLCDIRARVLEIFRSQRAISSVRQGIDRAIFANLLSIRADPTDLVITRERQRARQLNLRRLKVIDTFRKIRRVEEGIVINDVQGSDVGLNLSKVDVVPTVADITWNTDCTAPVRVLARICVYLLEDGRREATEGVENLAIILSPNVGVVVHAVADVLTHADGVSAFFIGFGADGLKDRLLAVRPHIFNHGLGGSRLLTVRHIGNF